MNLAALVSRLRPGVVVFAAMLALVAGRSASAQTNPAPQSLPYTQDFSALPPSSTVYPTGWQGWVISATLGSTFNTGGPASDGLLVANGSAGSTAGADYNYNGKIGFLNSSSGGDRTVALALNTGGFSNVVVQYDIMTIRNPQDASNNRVNEVTLQYRVGASGTWTSLTGIEYQNLSGVANNQTTTGVTTPQNLQTKGIPLPPACSNQPVVQLRWAQRQVSGAGSRPSFAVDNVLVNGSAANSHTINAAAGAGGSISPSGAVTVADGSNQSFTITPDDACHSIADVNVDGNSVGPVASYTFTAVTTDHGILATFAQVGPFPINSMSTGPGVIAPMGGVSVPCGGSQMFTMTAGNCATLADVAVDGHSVGAVATYTFTNVHAPHTIQATFAPSGSFTIAASAGAGGSIAPSGDVLVPCGADAGFTIQPDACHTIADVVVDGGSVGPVTTYTFNAVQAAHTISATFAAITETISAAAGAGGTIAPSGNVVVACGGTQGFTIQPDGCHVVGDVVVDGSSVGAVTSYAFNSVQTGHTIVASFVLIVHHITAAAGPNGSISPSGDVAVNCGDDQPFTFTPDPGYVVKDVVVDGSSVGPRNSYTFTITILDHTITVTFKIPLLAPPYDPNTWNDGPGDPPDPANGQGDNNCYNYATNQKTGHFSQPGQASGHPAATFDCAGISAAAIADGLVATTKDAVCDNGFKVALVFGQVQTRRGKQDDFHWYRQDANGTWSHKPGQTEATDKDASGNAITNPETADKGKCKDNTAQYANFCGYFCVTKTTVVNLTAGGGLPHVDELKQLVSAAPAAARPATTLSNQIFASALENSGSPDSAMTITNPADLNALVSKLTNLGPHPDPNWQSQLGYRGFRLIVDDVGAFGSARVRVWNGVVRIDQGANRNFYVDDYGLENWLAERFYGPSVVGVPTEPGVTRLASPMPNPFEVRSTIGFTLDRQGRVALRIYDLTGRMVRELVNADLGAGRHDVVWNGRDAAGSPLRSGAYFYKLSLDGKLVGSAKTVFLGR